MRSHSTVAARIAPVELPGQEAFLSDGSVIVWSGEGHHAGNVEFLACTTDIPRFDFGIIMMAPGRELEQHVREDEDDSFYMLDGESTFFFDSRIGLSD